MSRGSPAAVAASARILANVVPHEPAPSTATERAEPSRLPSEVTGHPFPGLLLPALHEAAVFRLLLLGRIPALRRRLFAPDLCQELGDRIHNGVGGPGQRGLVQGTAGEGAQVDRLAHNHPRL